MHENRFRAQQTNVYRPSRISTHFQHCRTGGCSCRRQEISWRPKDRELLPYAVSSSGIKTIVRSISMLDARCIHFRETTRARVLILLSKKQHIPILCQIRKVLSARTPRLNRHRQHKKCIKRSWSGCGIKTPIVTETHVLELWFRGC